MKNCKIRRDKAFLGAVIGAVGTIASSALNSYLSAKAQKEANEKAVAEQNKANAYITAQNLSNAYADQSYADDFNSRITFRAGGKLNLRGYDRIEMARMGTRKKRKC